ncbi:MAG TPA: FHA domain-containing protein, partial [Thermoanaerobaculia bacterium]|nr:FHA domain-containing protein [Thermoanaerobaculia bacterium]
MQFEFGEFLLDDAARRLTRRGEPVRLAPKAFELLTILVEERPRAIRKQELQEKLWPDVIVDEANLKNLVGEIRAALGEDRWIRTVHRFGYAFDAPREERSGVGARVVSQDRVHRLVAGENVIGRDDDCAVVLDFAGVSRRHARIIVANDVSTLEDLGSKNGTWKNEERVTSPVRLDDGDRIRLGAAVLVFRAG